jgi:ATP-dependent DNA helicase RecG
LVYSDKSISVINNTGVLFFIQNPSQHIPQSTVTCVAYKGNTKVNILDRKTFDLDLITNIDDAIGFLKRHLNIAYEIIEKRRKEKMEVPEVVLREAVVNAVTHRDYFEKGANVMIEVFDNRLEISSPGGLPKGLKPEDFGTRTLARNPLIAALLNRAKYIEKLGTGVPRIRKAMADAGLPEPDFTFDSFFTVVLERMYTPEKTISVSLNVSAKRLERMLYLLRQLHVGNVLNMKEVAFELKATEKNIRRDMLLLEEKGWIISGGTTSNRTYQLSEQAIEQLNALDSD